MTSNVPLLYCLTVLSVSMLEVVVRAFENELGVQVGTPAGY